MAMWNVVNGKMRVWDRELVIHIQSDGRYTAAVYTDIPPYRISGSVFQSFPFKLVTRFKTAYPDCPVFVRVNV